MKKSTDSSRPDFWTHRYASGETPWDFHGVPPALNSFLARSSPRGAVLIPGCGSGYEVQAFHQAGFDVTALDFSPAAVERARRALGPLAGKITFADFFAHDFGAHKFDLIYERTFLCSMPPARWPDYTARMAQLLRPAGKLIGFFWYGREPEPPPYPLTEKESGQLFGGKFRLVRSDAVADSLPVFGGKERWQEWERV